MNGLPLPPPSPYATYTEPVAHYRLLWDTTGIPLVSEQEGWAIIVPQYGRLTIYGREVGSPFEDDQEQLRWLKEQGVRVMGEWFSTACVEGELGTQDLAQCVPISVEEFSAAFVRGWKDDGPEG